MLQFLGLASYFRKFIPHFSDMAMPLYHLTKKTVSFQDTPQHRQAFESIKRCLVNPPVLAFADPELPYVLVSDASIYARLWGYFNSR